MGRRFWRTTALLGAAFFAVVPEAARASIIDYAFQVTETTGPLAGQTQSGTFGIDSRLAAPDQMYFAKGLVAALDFTFDGIHFDETTANTGALAFDDTGDLLLFGIGTDCTERGACVTSDTHVSWLIYEPWYDGLGFGYSLGDGPGQDWNGVLTYQKVAAVAEPSSFALLAGAFLGLLGLSRQRIRAEGRRKTR